MIEGIRVQTEKWNPTNWISAYIILYKNTAPNQESMLTSILLTFHQVAHSLDTSYNHLYIIIWYQYITVT